MSTVSGIRLGLCLLRYGPQQGVPVVSFCRQHHSVGDPKSTHSGKPPSCSISTVAHQKKTQTFRVNLSEISEEIKKAKSFKKRQFITNDKPVIDILESLGSCYRTPLMMEFNPGPGILTRGLLDAGFRVAALENERDFIPGLKKLEADSDGQLRVFYCNPYKLDPFFKRPIPPIMYAKDLMEELGISEVPWDAESPFNIFGILHHEDASNLLWRFLHAVYDRRIVFRYGRAELNFLMHEKMYKSLICGPADTVNYKARTVVCRIAFDCQLLLQLPASAFWKTHKKSNSKFSESANSHLYLVRLTPRRNLFDNTFLPGRGDLLITFIKQCFTKQNRTLREQLESWNPGYEEWVLQRLDLPEDIITREMLPHEFKHVFEILLLSQCYNQSFLLDHIQTNPFLLNFT